MAYYASLVAVLQLLDDIVRCNRYSKFFHSEHQVMNSVHQRFTCLHQTLKNYSSKGDQEGERVEARIRDAADRAHFLIGSEISYHLNEESPTLLQKILNLIFARASSSRVAESLLRLELEVGSVVEEVQAIITRRRSEDSQFNIDSAVEQGGAASTRGTKVGLEEALNVINYNLLDGGCKNFRVIRIVGAGGIGKTTLAKHAFDDDAVVCHFDCRAWVKVSQNYHQRNVYQSMISALGMSTTIPEGKEIERIYKYLKGRRYLVAVDDIWDIRVWDDMKRMFPDDGNGSRIILTTRLLDVALYPEATPDFFHEMKFLSADQSWNLLRERVFPNGHCPPALEAPGKLIANKCKGLPLAIVVIAGVLASNVKATRYDWQKILRDVTPILTRSDGDLSHALSLSYHNLPHHLKPCFLYMGNLYDTNGEISVSHLIKMWIAEGFVLSINGSQSLEEIGEEYVEDLVKRNLVIVTKKRFNGQFKVCVVHDLVKDFCKQRSQKENFFIEHENAGKNFMLDTWSFFNEDYPVCTLIWFIFENLLWYICHFIIIMLSCGAVFILLSNGGVFGAFCYGVVLGAALPGGAFSGGAVLTQSHISFRRFKLARVFHFPHWGLHSTPPSIFCSYLVKYLALRLSILHYEGLSRSITKLRNLQTLILNTFNSISLPPEIWEMTQLRHLIISRMSLPPVPGNNVLRKLEHLQTLSMVENFRFTTESIAMFPNLRKLKLRCTMRSASHGSPELYSLHNLVHLHLLEELKIDSRDPLFLPESFAFPLNLKKLTLKGCGLSWERLTVVGSLPNLLALRLRKGSVVGQNWEPIEEEFTSLKYLLMEELDLKCWNAGNIHFPRLEYLIIRRCVRLEEIPLEVGNIATLKVIDIYGSKLAGDSAKPILEEQQELGNVKLLVWVHKT